MNRRQMLESTMYFSKLTYVLAGVRPSFNLGATKYLVMPLQYALLYKLEWAVIEKYTWSLLLLLPREGLTFQSTECLPPPVNTCQLLVVTLNGFGGPQRMAVNNHCPGNRQCNCTFISQYSEQKHLSGVPRTLVDSSSCRPVGLIHLNTRLW